MLARRPERVGRDRVGHGRQQVLVVLLAPLVEHEHLLQVFLDRARVGRGPRGRGVFFVGRRGRYGRSDERVQAPVLAVALQDASAVVIHLLVQSARQVEAGGGAVGVGDDGAVGVERAADVAEEVGERGHEIGALTVCAG